MSINNWSLTNCNSNKKDKNTIFSKSARLDIYMEDKLFSHKHSSIKILTQSWIKVYNFKMLKYNCGEKNDNLGFISCKTKELTYEINIWQAGFHWN